MMNQNFLLPQANRIKDKLIKLTIKKCTDIETTTLEKIRINNLTLIEAKKEYLKLIGK